MTKEIINQPEVFYKDKDSSIPCIGSKEYHIKNTEEGYSFSVARYSIINEKPCHWSNGLSVTIEKNGVTITLNGEEMKQVINTLPRTIGGSY